MMEAKLFEKRMTNEEIKQFVEDVESHQIYVMDTKEKLEIGTRFFAIAGFFSKIPKEELEQIGMIYGRAEDTMPRSVNGIPMFTAIKFVHKEDLKKIMDYHKRRKNAVKSVEVEGGDE